MRRWAVALLLATAAPAYGLKVDTNHTGRASPDEAEVPIAAHAVAASSPTGRSTAFHAKSAATKGQASVPAVTAVQRIRPRISLEVPSFAGEWVPEALRSPIGRLRRVVTMLRDLLVKYRLVAFTSEIGEWETQDPLRAPLLVGVGSARPRCA